MEGSKKSNGHEDAEIRMPRLDDTRNAEGAIFRDENIPWSGVCSPGELRMVPVGNEVQVGEVD